MFEGLGDYFAMNMWPQPQMPPPPPPAPPPQQVQPPPPPPPQQQWGAQLPMSPNVEDRSQASPHVGYVPPQPQLQAPRGGWMDAPPMAEAPRVDVAEQMRGPSPLARDAGINDIWARPPGLRDMVQHPDNAQLTPEMQMSMVLNRGRMNDPDIMMRVNPKRRLPDLGRYGW